VFTLKGQRLAPSSGFRNYFDKKRVHMICKIPSIKLSSRENNRLWSGYHAEGRAIAGVWITLFSGVIIVIMIMIMNTMWYQTGYSFGKHSTRHDIGCTCFMDWKNFYTIYFHRRKTSLNFLFAGVPTNEISELQFTANNFLSSSKSPYFVG
jgi:hypothetical protein